MDSVSLEAVASGRQKRLKAVGFVVSGEVVRVEIEWLARWPNP